MNLSSGVKALLLILSLLALIVSCVPVTPVPNPTATPTASPTATRVPTQTPTSVPAPTPTVTRQPYASDFQLKPWIADDPFYASLVEKGRSDFYQSKNSSRGNYARVFAAEKLLRTSPDNWRDLAWQIVGTYPIGVPLPGMRPDEDMLAFLIEDLLNEQNVKFEKLLATMQDKVGTYVDCGRTYMAEALSIQGDFLVVNNLFGDHQNGFIFFVGSCEGTAIYALRNLDGKYQVEKFRDWQALEIPAAGFRLIVDKVSDVNNNDIPEIVIDELFGASGIPGARGETLEFYEWDSSRNMFISDRKRITENVCHMYQPCEDGWRIGETTIQGFYPIIVNDLYATMIGDIEGTPTCDNLVVEHTYLLKDAKFVEQNSKILPPTDERIECQISWALRVLNEVDSQSDIAISIISKALTNWPVAMNDLWGPASRDYFALRLGLIYDMLGKDENALALLNSVTTNPSNPDYAFVPQLASSYLEVRSKLGKVSACQEVNLMQAESQYENSSPYSIYFPLYDLRKIWGYGAGIWLYHNDELCNEDMVIEKLARQAPIEKFVSIDQWLITIGQKPLKTSTVFETSQMSAWLVSLPSQSIRFSFDSPDAGSIKRDDYEKIWLFASSPQGLSAKLITGTGQDADTAPTVDRLQLGAGDFLIAVKISRVDDRRFIVMRLASDGTIHSLLNIYGAEGYIDHFSNEITVVQKNYSYYQPDITVFNWNSELQRLDERKISFDFVAAQNEAEGFIFKDHNFSEAIVYVNEFLIQAPPEPIVRGACYLGKCDYYPEWYRPYMRYLLALAYEMSGQKDRARDIYFDLWQDYPSQVFGLAAQHRLNPIQP